MRIAPVTFALGGHTLLLRSAEKDDAALLLPYLKRVCGETPFLSRYADECKDYTIEEEEAFIASHAGASPAGTSSTTAPIWMRCR